MQPDEVIEKFKSAGALLEGHFILSSGLHSPVYLQCAIALQATAVAAEFGAAIAEQFRGEPTNSPLFVRLLVQTTAERSLRLLIKQCGSAVVFPKLAANRQFGQITPDSFSR